MTLFRVYKKEVATSIAIVWKAYVKRTYIVKPLPLQKSTIVMCKKIGAIIKLRKSKNFATDFKNEPFCRFDKFLIFCKNFLIKGKKIHQNDNQKRRSNNPTMLPAKTLVLKIQDPTNPPIKDTRNETIISSIKFI